MLPDRKKKVQYERFDSLLIEDSVSDFMTAPVLTMPKDAPMSAAKAMMRDQRISGIPIVDKERVLLGLISIENLIIALEEGKIKDPIEKHMVTDVVYLTEDMDVSAIIEFFMNYPYGRFPVLDDQRRVVGIVTHGDLMLHMLERLGNVYLHDKRREAVHTPSKWLLTPEDCETDQGGFCYDIESAELDTAGQGATLFKKYLIKEGFPAEATRRASIIAYEAEVNVVLHAYGQGQIRASIRDDQLFIQVTDNGPGIENIELAMQPGWTTATDEVRERGFGAGMGLDNIKKYSDKLIILSSDSGIKMEVVILASADENDDDAGDAVEGAA